MMTTSNASPVASPRRFVSSRRRTEAPQRFSPDSPPMRKMKSMAEIMAKAKYVEVEQESYNDIVCEKCGSGDGDEELLLCDKCDRGFHTKCLTPILARVPTGPWVCHDCSGERRSRSFSQKKILDFFRIEKRIDPKDKLERAQDVRKHKRKGGQLVMKKRSRKLLPFVPSEDPFLRLKQMSSLASALSALHIEYCDDLIYKRGMPPRSANQAKYEKGGMQVLSKDDIETLEHCRAMSRRGEFPPLTVVFDPREGYTVEANNSIKDLTFIVEYVGGVDYLNKRENDDCDSLMTLLLAEDSSKSLVICPDKYANISRFINGVNNHTPGGKKKQNCKCVRYDVNGESRVLIVATRDIAKGERLYYDYNEYEYGYPTHNFI